MQWEKLTAGGFETAARDIGVCIVNVSVLERHSDHLPLGTDMLIGHALACRAAEKEPAVVFPPYYFGKIFEATCYPGAVALKPELMVALAQNVFDEIARNGFKKIFILNSHGGNVNFLRHLIDCHLAADKDYDLYLPQWFIPEELHEAHRAICPLPLVEHAGEIETSFVMALYPDLVDESKRPAAGAVKQGRQDHLKGLETAMGWYADFPDHYAGDGHKASAEKGRRLMELYTDGLASQIAAIKRDEATPSLREEFQQRRHDVGDTC